MSEEQRKDEETEVEGHDASRPSTARTTSQATRSRATSFPPKYGANDEPEDEVEGHVHRRS